MKPQPLHEKLRLAAHIVEHNLPWEYTVPQGEWVTIPDGCRINDVVALPNSSIRLADGWLPHYGGACPCSGAQRVDFFVRHGTKFVRTDKAGELRWTNAGLINDIIVWRPANGIVFPTLPDNEQTHREDRDADGNPTLWEPCYKEVEV